MEKVLVLGSSGAGKSTAAKELGEITGLPVVHLDSIYWQPNWVRTEKEAWQNKVKEICTMPKWIIDGNFESTLDYRLNQADTIIVLYYPRTTCLLGIFKRRMTHVRPDHLNSCKEKIDWEFFRYVWTFNRIMIPKILGKLKKLDNKKIFIIKNKKQLKKFFNDIKNRQ